MEKRWPKLTEKQIFALVCVRNKAVKEGVKSLNGYRSFITFFAYDSDITTQIKSLKRRGLIKYERLGVHDYQDRCIVLTELGKQHLLRAKESEHAVLP